MRTFLDVVENLTDSARMIVGFLVLLIFGGIIVITFGATYAVGNATEELSEIAQNATQETMELNREAIEAVKQAERDRALAKEGWGFDGSSSKSRANDGFGEETGSQNDRRRKRRSRDGDWGSAQ